jgi:hypothetical protein
VAQEVVGLADRAAVHVVLEVGHDHHEPGQPPAAQVRSEPVERDYPVAAGRRGVDVVKVGEGIGLLGVRAGPDYGRAGRRQALVVGLPGDVGPLQLVDQVAAGPVAAAAVAVEAERAPGQQGHVVGQRRVRDRVVAGEQRPVRRQPVQERRPAGPDDLAKLMVLLDHEHHPGHPRRWPPGRLPGRVAQGRRGGMDRRAQTLHRLRHHQHHHRHHGRQQHPADPVATRLAGPAGDEDREQPGDTEAGAGEPRR